jgi:hypothetical protein
LLVARVGGVGEQLVRVGLGDGERGADVGQCGLLPAGDEPRQHRQAQHEAGQAGDADEGPGAERQPAAP